MAKRSRVLRPGRRRAFDQDFHDNTYGKTEQASQMIGIGASELP